MVANPVLFHHPTPADRQRPSACRPVPSSGPARQRRLSVEVGRRGSVILGGREPSRPTTTHNLGRHVPKSNHAARNCLLIATLFSSNIHFRWTPGKGNCVFLRTTLHFCVGMISADDYPEPARRERGAGKIAGPARIHKGISIERRRRWNKQRSMP